MPEEGDGQDFEVLSEIIDPSELQKLSSLSKRKLETLIVSAKFEMINSPLIPPALLKDYDSAVPGLASKLVQWTEEESNHRRAMEIRAFDEIKVLRVRGQTSGVVVAVFGIIASCIIGTFSAIYQSLAAGGAASVIAIVSVGGPFAARLLASRWANHDDADG